MLQLSEEQIQVVKEALAKDIKAQEWIIHQFGSDELEWIEADRILSIELAILEKLKTQQE